jgi:hypothetical protein
MLVRIVSLALLLWLPASSGAADAGGSFAVKGVGLSKCSDFVKAIQDKNTETISSYVGWVAGFITASNQHSAETFDLTPWQNLRTLTAALVGHCDKNADRRFGEAVVRMAATLRADRLLERSDLIAIDHEGRKHYVYKETMRRAQAALGDLGLYSGDVTGEFDTDTRAALETFQTEEKLPVSGLPDQQTLYTLFRKSEG